MARHSPFDIVGTFSFCGWQRAARCGPDGGNCVEVNCSIAGVVAVRDSKLFPSPVLALGDDQWRCFVSAACTGRYTAAGRATHTARLARPGPRHYDMAENGHSRRSGAPFSIRCRLVSSQDLAAFTLSAAGPARGSPSRDVPTQRPTPTQDLRSWAPGPAWAPVMVMSGSCSITALYRLIIRSGCLNPGWQKGWA